MEAGIPFNQAEVATGLRLALQVGWPQDPSLRPVFMMRGTEPAPVGPEDADGVPFDPSAVDTHPTLTPVSVLMAVEEEERPGVHVDWTQIIPTRLVLTLIADDYALVEGFDHVLIGSERFYYVREKVPMALVTLGIHQVVVRAEDDS